MAAINREFLVDLPQLASFIEYLLPKTDGIFLAIDLFAIGGSPSATPSDQPTINAPTGYGLFPTAEFSLVAGARCHSRQLVEGPGNLMVDKIQASGGGVGLHGVIPVVIGKIHQLSHQLRIFFRGQAGDGFFDFNHGAHLILS
jgi:hypothetical protein